MALDDPTVRTFRPTVEVGGQRLPALSANILRMCMTEQLGGMSALELSLVDVLSAGDGTGSFGATAGSPVRLGAAIRIFGGSDEAAQELFDGAITAIEGEYSPTQSPLFTVLAEDRLFRLRRRRRSRIFEAMSPVEVVKAVAQDHGLTPDVRDLTAPSGTWAQVAESDLAFLRRLLERFDADMQVVGDKLQAGPRARDARASVSLRLGDTLLRARLTADLAEQTTEARVSGFDPATGEAVDAKATAGEMGPGSGRDGPAILEELIGDTPEQNGHEGPLTDREADLVARALYGRRARRFVRVDATAQGNAMLRVGSKVSIRGVNPFFENDYSVTQAVHRFDLDTGYLTDFLAEGAYLGAGA